MGGYNKRCLEFVVFCVFFIGSGVMEREVEIDNEIGDCEEYRVDFKIIN